jgi:hypothetical protein
VQVLEDRYQVLFGDLTKSRQEVKQTAALIDDCDLATVCDCYTWRIEFYYFIILIYLFI